MHAHEFCICLPAPPQGEKWMHSLLHNKDSYQCGEPFSHLESLNQRGCIPERDEEENRGANVSESAAGSLRYTDQD